MGTELGFGGPEYEKDRYAWRTMITIQDQIGNRRLWFEVLRWIHGRILIVEGKPCLPFNLVERWATQHSAEFLGWEFRPDNWDKLWDSAAEAVVPPPLPMRWWADHRQELPGGTRLVLLDETDPRLSPTVSRKKGKAERC